MTPDIFVNNLADEITAIFKGSTLKNSEGNEVPLNIFTHEIPVKSGEDIELPEPYVVVKVNSGNINSEDEPQVVTAVCLICTFDDDSERQGSKDVLHIIHKIYERFAKDPRLGCACMKYPLDWILQEEDIYPYYLGGLQMLFEIPAVKKEDPLA